MRLVLAQLLAAAFVAVTVPAEAEYRSCSVSNGQVMACSGSYSGSSVLFVDGAYRVCSLSSGRVLACRGWAQGEAPLFFEDAWRSVRFVNGQIAGVGSWYAGRVAVER